MAAAADDEEEAVASSEAEAEGGVRLEAELEEAEAEAGEEEAEDAEEAEAGEGTAEVADAAVDATEAVEEEEAVEVSSVLLCAESAASIVVVAPEPGTSSGGKGEGRAMDAEEETEEAEEEGATAAPVAEAEFMGGVTRRTGEAGSVGVEAVAFGLEPGAVGVSGPDPPEPRELADPGPAASARRALNRAEPLLFARLCLLFAALASEAAASRIRAVACWAICRCNAVGLRMLGRALALGVVVDLGGLDMPHTWASVS